MLQTWKQIDVSEVKRRSKLVFEQINKITSENNKNWIGWTGKVLFDEKTDDGIKGQKLCIQTCFCKRYSGNWRISSCKDYRFNSKQPSWSDRKLNFLDLEFD